MTGWRIMSFFLLIFCLLLGCEKNRFPPEGLIGRWETTDQPYADRFFEIQKTTITFGQGENTSETHTITEVEVEKVQGKNDLFTIHYKIGKGQETKFIFYHDPAGKGSIRIKNQDKMLWTKP